MAKITKIEPQIPALPTRKKVAAYARVSMDADQIGRASCRERV